MCCCASTASSAATSIWVPSPSRRVECGVLAHGHVPRVDAGSARPDRGVDLEFDLRDGETIWTESSYKYMPDALITQLEDGGFESMAQWIDRDAGFALTLARPRATVSG